MPVRVLHRQASFADPAQPAQRKYDKLLRIPSEQRMDPPEQAFPAQNRHGPRRQPQWPLGYFPMVNVELADRDSTPVGDDGVLGRDPQLGGPGDCGQSQGRRNAGRPWFAMTLLGQQLPQTAVTHERSCPSPAG
jgi:hypothetical protein